jgi:hypothetical protein
MSQSNAPDPVTQPEPWWEHAHPAFPDEPGLSPEDEAWYVQHVSQRYGDPAELRPGTLADLARSVAGYLTGLGLEPGVRLPDSDQGAPGLTIRFEFLGHLIQLNVEDVDRRLEDLAREERSDAPWWNEDADPHRVNAVG